MLAAGLLFVITLPSAAQEPRDPSGLGIASQAVLVVGGPGGPDVDYAQPSQAVAAAEEGDIVVLLPPAPGDPFQPFVIDGKSVTVVALDPSATLFAPGDPLVVRNLGARQVVRLEGLRGAPLELENIAGEIYGGGLGLCALTVRGSTGSLWIEDTVVEALPGIPAPSGAAVNIEDARAVVLRSLTIAPAFGGVPGLRASASNVHLYESRIDPPMPDASGLGVPGAVLEAGTLVFGLNSTIEGGAAATAGGPCGLVAGGAGLRVDDARAFLRDVAVTGGPGADPCALPPFPLADPLVLSGTGLVRTRTGIVHRMHASSPVRLDELVTVDFEGVPGELVCLFLSTQAEPAFVASHFTGLTLGSPVFPIGKLTLDAAGRGRFMMRADLVAGILAEVFYAQALFLDASAPAGQRATLGPPSAILLLHPSL